MARWPLRRRPQQRPRVAATTLGNVEGQLRWTWQQQETLQQQQASLELGPAAVLSLTLSLLGPCSRLMQWGRWHWQGRRGLALLQSPKQSQPQERPPTCLHSWKQNRHQLQNKGFSVVWGEVGELIVIAHHAPKMWWDSWKRLVIFGDFHPISVSIASFFNHLQKDI